MPLTSRYPPAAVLVSPRAEAYRIAHQFHERGWTWDVQYSPVHYAWWAFALERIDAAH